MTNPEHVWKNAVPSREKNAPRSAVRNKVRFFESLQDVERKNDSEDKRSGAESGVATERSMMKPGAGNASERIKQLAKRFEQGADARSTQNFRNQVRAGQLNHVVQMGATATTSSSSSSSSSATRQRQNIAQRAEARQATRPPADISARNKNAYKIAQELRSELQNLSDDEAVNDKAYQALFELLELFSKDNDDQFLALLGRDHGGNFVNAFVTVFKKLTGLDIGLAPGLKRKEQLNAGKENKKEKEKEEEEETDDEEDVDEKKSGKDWRAKESWEEDPGKTFADVDLHNIDDKTSRVSKVELTARRLYYKFCVAKPVVGVAYAIESASQVNLAARAFNSLFDDASKVLDENEFKALDLSYQEILTTVKKIKKVVTEASSRQDAEKECNPLFKKIRAAEKGHLVVGVKGGVQVSVFSEEGRPRIALYRGIPASIFEQKYNRAAVEGPLLSRKLCYFLQLGDMTVFSGDASFGAVRNEDLAFWKGIFGKGRSTVEGTFEDHIGTIKRKYHIGKGYRFDVTSPEVGEFKKEKAARLLWEALGEVLGKDKPLEIRGDFVYPVDEEKKSTG